jgi:hypothetical protein
VPQAYIALKKWIGVLRFPPAAGYEAIIGEVILREAEWQNWRDVYDVLRKDAFVRIVEAGGGRPGVSREQKIGSTGSGGVSPHAATEL